VLAISPADVHAVIEGARRQAAKEAAALASIAEGRFDRSWVATQRDRMMNG
jgi:DNA-binding transcriptional regulator YdaS (Cro superfamily)